MPNPEVINSNTIAACDDVQLLLEELRSCQIRWLQELDKMASIVRRLDQLGVEISIENSLLPYIRLIAHGQLSSHLFLAWHCEPPLLEKAMRLPLPLQERIADNEPLKVMTVDGDHRLVRPGDMTLREIKQVFHRSRLRTDAEQVGWIRDQQLKATAKAGATPTEGDGVAVDRKRKGIVVNGRFLSLAELAGFVASLSR